MEIRQFVDGKEVDHPTTLIIDKIEIVGHSNREYSRMVEFLVEENLLNRFVKWKKRKEKEARRK